MQVQSLGWEDLLEEGMAIHSSTVAMENPMDRGAWQAMVHSVAQIWTQLKRLSTHTWLYVSQSSVFCFRLFQLSSSGGCPCSKSSS